jgi:hypothetical protein
MTRGKRYGNGGPLSGLFSHGVKKALGLRAEDKWPELGMSGVVNGVFITVAPSGKTMSRDGMVEDSGARKPRRVFAVCPRCMDTVCAGHLGQHMHVHSALARAAAGRPSGMGGLT